MALKIKTFTSREAATEASEKSGGAGVIWGIPKDGCTVRFLTDSSGFIGYHEYFDEDLNSYVPVDEDDTLPEGARMSFRFLANCAWTSEGGNKGKVIALKIPQKLARKLFAKEKRYDGLTDRDYTFSRLGTGFDTEYDVDAEPVSKMATTKFKPYDLIEELEKVRAAAFGSSEEEKPAAKGKAPTPPAKAPAKPAATKSQTLGEQADDGDEDAQSALTELAEAADLDPDDFPSWSELEDALPSDDDEEEDDEEDEAEEDDEEEDDGDEDAEEASGEFTKLGHLVDDEEDEDGDAETALVEAAEAAGVDPDDYESWVELGEFLDSNEPSDDEEEEREIDVDELDGMSITELRDLANDLDLDVRKLSTKAKLIAAIIEAAEEA